MFVSKIYLSLRKLQIDKLSEQMARVFNNNLYLQHFIFILLFT